MTIDEVVDLLHARRTGPDRWMASCPTAVYPHGDRNRSLSIRLRNGRRLYHCFVGCRYAEIARALGVRSSELLGVASDRPVRRRVRARSPHDIALELARAERWVEALPTYEVADSIRTGWQTVGTVRQWATARGDTETAWELLRLAAELETETRAIEAFDWAS